MALGNKEEIVQKVAEITDRVGLPQGIEAVEVELLGGGKARTLRIYIDKPGGVSHADCEFISQHVGTVLDVEDIIPGDSYTLEVSSPGVERKLVKPADFRRFAGQKARFVLHDPLDNQKHWEGILKGLEGNLITIETAGRSLQFPLEQVRKANLIFEW